MLDRPPSRRTLSQRDWRRRADRGEACAWFTYDTDTVDYLVAHRWLDADRRDDKRAIGDAASRALRDSAKAWLTEK
jgi:hypothetical protein